MTQEQIGLIHAVLCGTDGNGGGLTPEKLTVYNSSRFTRLQYFLDFNTSEGGAGKMMGMLARKCLQLTHARLRKGNSKKLVQGATWTEYNGQGRDALITAYAVEFVIPKLIQSVKMKLKALHDQQTLDAAKKVIPYPGHVEGGPKYNPTANYGVLDEPFMAMHTAWQAEVASGIKKEDSLLVNADILSDLATMQDGAALDYELFRHMYADDAWTPLVPKPEDWLAIDADKLPMTYSLKRAYSFIETAVREAEKQHMNDMVSTHAQHSCDTHTPLSLSLSLSLSHPTTHTHTHTNTVG
jgi:hypothetical protein